MSYPFQKKDNTTLVIALAAGALTAGVIAWLYLTEKGEATRNDLFDKVKDVAKNLAADIISDKTGVRKKTVKKVADQVGE